MAASKPVPVAWIECPNCRSVIQRTLRYLRSTPGLWCEACVKWAANDDIKIVDVRMAGDRRKLNGCAPRRPGSIEAPAAMAMGNPNFRESFTESRLIPTKQVVGQHAADRGDG